MSESFHILCRETGDHLCIGQGWGSMEAFYSGDPDTMRRLGRFLMATQGKLLEVLCADRNDWIYDREEFEEERR